MSKLEKIVGGLIGGAAGFLAAKKYYSTISAALAAATYPIMIGTGALAFSYAANKLFK